MRFADLGHNVFVSDYEYCDYVQYQACVHIWHPYHKGRGMCRLTSVASDTTAKQGDAGNLFLEYADAQPLTTARVGGEPFTLDAFADFVRAPRPLLIHCAAGLTRSPTWAIMAKVVRGCDFWTAITETVEGMRRGYGDDRWPMLFGAPLKDIYAYWFVRQGMVVL